MNNNPEVGLKQGLCPIPSGFGQLNPALGVVRVFDSSLPLKGFQEMERDPRTAQAAIPPVSFGGAEKGKGHLVCFLPIGILGLVAFFAHAQFLVNSFLKGFHTDKNPSMNP